MCFSFSLYSLALGNSLLSLFCVGKACVLFFRPCVQLCAQRRCAMVPLSHFVELIEASCRCDARARSRRRREKTRPRTFASRTSRPACSREPKRRPRRGSSRCRLASFVASRRAANAEAPPRDLGKTTRRRARGKRIEARPARPPARWTPRATHRCRTGLGPPHLFRVPGRGRARVRREGGWARPRDFRG